VMSMNLWTSTAAPTCSHRLLRGEARVHGEEGVDGDAVRRHDLVALGGRRRLSPSRQEEGERERPREDERVGTGEEGLGRPKIPTDRGRIATPEIKKRDARHCRCCEFEQ
jgi:hypothetical protein